MTERAGTHYVAKWSNQYIYIYIPITIQVKCVVDNPKFQYGKVRLNVYWDNEEISLMRTEVVNGKQFANLAQVQL